MGLAGTLLLAVLTGSGCTSVDPPPANLAVGEGNLIHAEWAVDEPQPNVRRISGYIVNTYDYFATQVQVLVEAFDQREQLVERRLQWVPGAVPPSHRSFFEVRNVPPADRYRVTVPRYTWRDSDAGPMEPF